MSRSTRIRQWLRVAHRELSYIFAGALLVYAISGIAFNHKDTFGKDYSIVRTEFVVDADHLFDSKNRLVLNDPNTQQPLQEIQHYAPDSLSIKVFLKGNATLEVNKATGQAVLEQVHKKPILGALSKLHYNSKKLKQGWTLFSDIFAVAMIVLVVTGIFMLRGKHSLWGTGGIEFLIGILIPLLFILL